MTSSYQPPFAVQHPHPWRQHGGHARCESCVIPRLLGSEWNSGPTLVPGTSPIPNEEKDGALFAIVGEAPGEDETRAHSPFVGASGRILAESLMSHGYGRSSYDLYNVCHCRPPGNDMTAAVRKAKAMGLPSPVDCCRGSLLAALRRKGHRRVVALGGTAAKVLMRTAQGIFSLRGGPAEIEWTRLAAAGSVGAGDADEDDVGAVTMGSHAVGEKGDTLQVLPTFHPAFVARSHRWMPVFLADLGRALRLFTGTLRWTDPVITYQPTADALYTWLTTAHVDGERPPFWTFDFETTIADPMVNEMLCLAISTRDEAMVVGLRSVEEARRLQALYGPAEEQRIREVIKWFFASRDHLKCAHNYAFDCQVARHHFGVVPEPHFDSILLHRLENSEIPHGLGVVGSIMTDVSAWKSDHEGNKLATHASTDRALHLYCALDACVTWRIVPPLWEKVTRRQLQVAEALGVRDPVTGAPVDRCPALPGFSLVQVDHKRQEFCVGMHRNGMWVDQVERARLEEKYEKEAARLKKEMLDIAAAAGWGKLGDLDSRDAGSFDSKEDEDEAADHEAAKAEGEINPSSYDHIRDLLYETWGLIPVDFTDSGLPSTSNACIREHLADRALTREQRALLDALRRYRRIKDKYLGTYIRKAAIGDRDGYGTRLVRVQGKRKMLERQVKALAWPSDGRIRASWNAHVTNVGRIACSNPNLMNQPGKLRSMYGPAPGNVWVLADVNAFHLAIIANRWRIERLLRCFRSGEDPHLLLGVDLFGERLLQAQGFNGLSAKPAKDSKAEGIRDISKTLRYAGAYGAGAETIWKTMTRAEDKRTGDLIYLDLTLREVQAMVNKWMQVEPEWKASWEFEVAVWQKYGFTCDSILGRRCDFSDCVGGEADRSAIANYPILASEASICGIMEIEINRELPHECFGPGTGQVANVHDELIWEVPEREAERALAVMTRGMNLTIPGWEIPITAEAHIARRWKDPT